MNQRQRILELVKNASITVEQGLELMSALESSESLPMRPPAPPTPPAPPAWRTGRPNVKVGRPFASGRGQLSFDQIVQLGVHGIKPNYIEELRKAGLENVPFPELMQLIVHQIPVSYVLELRELEQQLEVEPLSVAQIVQLGIHRISADYALEMRRLGIEHGFAPLTVDQIVQLGIHKIKPSYVLELLKTGAFNLNTPSAAESEFEERRAKLKVKPAKATLMSQLDRFQAKRARAEAKLAWATAKGEHQASREENDDQLERLDSEMSEADILVEAAEHLFPKGFDIRSSIDPNLPMDAQKLALEEMIEDVNAQIGIATNADDRAALLELHRQITAELGQLATE